MSATDYLVGLAFFAGTTGAVLAAAALVLTRCLGHVRGAARVLAYAVTATAMLLVSHLLPGVLGILTRGTALGSALLVLAVAAASTRRRPPDTSIARPGGVPRVWASRGNFALAAVGLLALVVCQLSLVRLLLPRPPTGIDALTFHLPDIARWIQTGSLWPVSQFVPGQAHGNYPQNGNVVMLASILPWHNNFLVRAWLLPYLALTGVAVYAIARELRAPRPSAVLAGTLVVALPTVTFDTVFGTMPDAVMFTCFGAGAVFLLRHWRTGARSDLVLAGVALGVAFGTKWYAVSSVLVLLGIWAVARLALRRQLRAVLGQAGLLVGLVGLFGGFWLVRNLVESGNPLFPVKVSVLGATIFDAPPDRIRMQAGFSLLHYVDRPGVWRDYFVPAWEHSLGWAAVVLAAGVVLAAVCALRREQGGGRSRMLTAAAWAAGLFLAYAATPYTAFGPEGRPLLAFVNVRYAVPAAIVAAAIAGALGGGRRRAPVLLVQVCLLIGVADGLRRGIFAGRLDLGVRADDVLVAAALVVAAVAIVTALRYLVLHRVGAPRRGRAQAACAAALLVSLVTLGWHEQRVFNEGYYAAAEPPISWVSEKAGTGHRVGLVGTWSDDGLSPVQPSFGPRLGNIVTYVGPLDRGLPGQYNDSTQLLGALRSGRFDLVMVGHGSPPSPTVREESWLRSAGFALIARSRRLSLFRAPPSA